ncbi:hypothetical protein [Haloplanus pelagicus]|uniref:hypothetical protein n=1 Tax=Haloplanus pelagicus TaxID=2949995 RepID=UPI002041E7BD|nr:hypothetical protein [Haloplanus sp. HW8-1]
MANIEITAVEMTNSWATGVPQSVDVKIDNHESMGPAGWGPVVCPSDGIWNAGHMTDVSLRIEDADTGAVVWSATKPTCIPVERPSTSLGANAIVHFEPSVDSSGNYVVSAEVQVRGDNGKDTSDLYPLTVGSGGSDLPPNGDERGAGLFPGAGDVPVDDVLDDPLGAMADNPAIALGAVLALLIVLRPYASLGASATG